MKRRIENEFLLKKEIRVLVVMCLNYYKHLLNELTPDIDLVGKTVQVDNIPLKNLDLIAVEKNIVIFRESNPNSFYGEGFTLVYFMDSEESALDMKNNKIPYLMVPQGTFHSGGNPITDIWKKNQNVIFAI